MEISLDLLFQWYGEAMVRVRFLEQEIDRLRSSIREIALAAEDHPLTEEDYGQDTREL